jgi:LAO/AO transport system kinase
MREHALDPGVYVRSMASRGHLGGLSVAAPQALRVLTAAGFDDVLVETVGVGQSEVEIAARVDSTVVLLAPGAGDELQAAKAGVLEIGDLFVLNKADRDGADAAVRDLENMIRLGGPREPGEWRQPVLRCIGVTGTGVAELLAALDAHHDWALRSGALHRRRARRAALEVETIALAVLRQRIDQLWARTPPDRAAGHGVAGGRRDPYVAADRLLAELG